jgi:Ni/Co efflux regulator RcnB
MLKVLVPAVIATTLAVTSATTVLAAPQVLQFKTTVPVESIEQIQYNERKGAHRQKRAQHYTPGRRYKSAPSHYRRYAHRPSDWRSRGCILVGPLWFCA